MGNPQSWNRYSYTRGNPLKYLDPTGAIVSLAGLSEAERKKFLMSLAEATGNSYGIDENGNLQLTGVGEGSSPTATKIVDDLINHDSVFAVEACNECGVVFAAANTATNQIYLDFSDFQYLNYGRVTPGSFSLGSQFLHEGLHVLNPSLTDPDLPGARGPFVDGVNQVRQERGLDLGDEYQGHRDYGRVTIFFEAQGWRRGLGLRNEVTYPFSTVTHGPKPQ